MIFLTHLALALLACVLLAKAMPGQISTAFLLTALLFSVFPDIDIGSSFIGKYFKVINFFMRHRGITHTIFFMVICIIASFIITSSPAIAWATLLGYSSHLLLDALTRSGIVPFWPSQICIKGPFRSGGIVDFAMFLLMAGVAVTILV